LAGKPRAARDPGHLDGIDYFGGSGPVNSYVDTLIDDAQKAGVLIHAIYANGVGHYARSYWRMYWGQNFLSRVADGNWRRSLFPRLRDGCFLFSLPLGSDAPASTTNTCSSLSQNRMKKADSPA